MVDRIIQRDAVISACGRYRYRLSRIWDPRKPSLVWIMLNPSTADADTDDPTIRRCMGFSHREDCGGIEVLNLFAWRATSPQGLRKTYYPIGPDNDGWIKEVLHPHSRVVAAWGNHGSYLGRGDTVMKNLIKSGLHVLCLGDKPRHPLYISGDQPLIRKC